MNCPHCRVSFHDEFTRVEVGKDNDGWWHIDRQVCPECGRLILFLVRVVFDRSANGTMIEHEVSRTLVKPKGVSRSPCPTEVPKGIAEDYIEACLVLSDSPKASAALSRRCLQNILREAAQVKHSDLAKEIQEAVNSGKLPTHLAEVLDAVRNIGNFAAHPMKSTQSGDILPVEPHEAEWNLDVVEGLFDFYYVQPAITLKKKAALNLKLQEAGKQPMK